MRLFFVAGATVHSEIMTSGVCCVPRCIVEEKSGTLRAERMSAMKERINYHEHDVQEETSPVASANECTGLMFTPPENSQELESYQQLSPMAIPRKEPGAAPQAKVCPGDGKRPQLRQ